MPDDRHVKRFRSSGGYCSPFLVARDGHRTKLEFGEWTGNVVNDETRLFEARGQWAGTSSDHC
jgi:hypothetical protein